MALKIFGTDPETQPKPRTSFADDIVGRFRAGYVVNKRPATVNEWRVTTGDPEVADAIHELLGGDEPQNWDATGEDNIEVFTASAEVDIVIERPTHLRSRMVLWGRNGKLIESSDGEYLYDEQGNLTSDPDPDASLSFQERKAKAREGVGKEPDISLLFRLAENPDLGKFRFKTGSWGFASDLAYNDVETKLNDIDGPVAATLKLEPVSFTAKNGPRAGQVVSYTKSTLVIKGAA